MASKAAKLDGIARVCERKKIIWHDFTLKQGCVFMQRINPETGRVEYFASWCVPSHAFGVDGETRPNTIIVYYLSDGDDDGSLNCLRQRWRYKQMPVDCDIAWRLILAKGRYNYAHLRDKYNCPLQAHELVTGALYGYNAMMKEVHHREELTYDWVESGGELECEFLR